MASESSFQTLKMKPSSSEKNYVIGFLDRIITTDEAWFHYYDPETKQQSGQWKNVDSPRPKKAKVRKSLGKNMYSPDLAPMDFAVFPYIKSFLRGMRFDNLSELRQNRIECNISHEN